MIPLHHDPWFNFRFADDRLIPRFHLEGVEVGRRVTVFRIDADTGERLELLATATVGEGGWVDLPEPITIRAGEAFIAVPKLTGRPTPWIGECVLVARLSQRLNTGIKAGTREDVPPHIEWLTHGSAGPRTGD